MADDAKAQFNNSKLNPRDGFLPVVVVVIEIWMSNLTWKCLREREKCLNIILIPRLMKFPFRRRH